MNIFQMKYLKILPSLRLVPGDYFQFLALWLSLQAQIKRKWGLEAKLLTSYFPFFFVFFLLRPTSGTLWYTLLDFQKHHHVSVHFENDLLSLFIGACMLVCNSVLNHLYLFNNHILFEESRNCQDGSKEPNITHFARTEILSFGPPSLLCLQI